MHRAVILDLEQIRMRLHHLDDEAVALQPARGHEDRRRNVVLDQGAEDAHVGRAAAGIERQGDARRSALSIWIGRQPQIRLHEPRCCDSRLGEHGEGEERQGNGFHGNPEINEAGDL
ncbi:hypothetical protein D9M72_526130 [compost metagenome]